LDSTEPMVMNPMIAELIPFMNPEVIEAESLFDLIDEDMNYPDWD